MKKIMFALFVLVSASTVHAECSDKKSANWLQPIEEKISYQKPLVAYRGACCKICTTGQACGDSCIADWMVCHQYGGCACNG